MPTSQRLQRRITAATATASVAGMIALLASCSSAADPTPEAAVTPPSVAVPSGPSASPLPATATWQWQLSGDLDTSHDVDVYDIDLFDTDADTIDELHADGRTVICYFSAGSIEDWRDDAAAFPSDAIGSPLDGWEGERWVDTRRSEVRGVIVSRLDLAASKGCDGVEPDNVTAYEDDSGFPIGAEDQLDFNRFLASEAHRRDLLIGLKNDLDQIVDLVDQFDFAVNEQCHEYDECDAYAPFVSAGKPVFNAEYDDHFVDAPDELCAQAERWNTTTLVLPLDLDGSFRIACS